MIRNILERRALGIAAVVVLFIGIFVFVNSLSQNGKISSNTAEINSLKAQREALGKGMAANQTEVARLGGTPIGPKPSDIIKSVPPSDKVIAPQTSPNIPVETVRPSLSPAQKQNLVQEVLDKIKVPQGQAPSSSVLSKAIAATLTDHPNLVSAQISGAVMDYLLDHEKNFKGKPGTNGTDGKPGAPCDADTNPDCVGPQGTGVSDFGIDINPDTGDYYLILILSDGTQVETSTPLPRGPKGDTGLTGPSGAPCDPGVNPACIGPSGAKGDKGDPPTAEDLDAAVSRWINDHPNAFPLCPDDAPMTTVNIRAADGGILTTKVCLVSSTEPTVPPPSTSDVPTAPPS